jgi:ABC-type multidrug transport system fused ATPase/permease subunit
MADKTDKTSKQENIFISSYKNFFAFVDKEDRWGAYGLICLFVLSSIVDVFGIASIIPVIQVAANPQSIHEKAYLQKVFHIGGFTSETHFLLALMLAVFIFFILKNIFSVFVSYRQMKFSTALSMKVIKKQFSKYYYLDYWKFKDIGSSTIINHVNRTPDRFTSNYMQNFFQIISQSLIILFIILGIALYKPVLFLIMTVILGPTTILIYLSLKNKSQELGHKMDDLMPEAYGLLNDSFMGYVDLKLAGKEEQFQEKYYKNRRTYYDHYIWSSIIKKVPKKVIEVVAISGIMLIFFYSLLISGQPGEVFTLLGVFVAAAYKLMPSINRILSAFMGLKNSQYVLDNIEAYKEHVSKPPEEQLDLSFNNEIKFDDLSFSFPDADEPLLKHLNFTVKKGDKIGFVGESGSGKTTLMNIILRFYKETEGAIKVDGIPLTDHHYDAWRSMLGYVRQNYFVMEGSIRDNVTLGDKVVDKERLYRSLEQASLSDLVDRLPQGIHTEVGEQGSRLSGGKRQRLGIARALYHNAEILVFDEATSNLDNETEREVTESINRLSHTDYTLFIVAHRITTLKNCDRIFEISDGEIIAEHQYEELVRAVV